MDGNEIQTALPATGVRVEIETAEYVARVVQSSPKGGKLAILGGNARTGVPMRQLIALDDLSNARPAAS